MSLHANLPATYFLSCDWGTSAFRLRLVELGSLAIRAECSSSDGIAAVYAAWQNAGAKPEQRRGCYFAVLRRQIAALEAKGGHALAGIPLVISGMISSSIGLQVLSYKQMPFAVDGSDLRAEILDAVDDFDHEVMVISGACTGDDVMRGEETQLVGALAQLADRNSERMLVFPGTHSKHILVCGGHAVLLKTYMTGEFFELLSQRSVLASSVGSGVGSEQAESRANFEAGVREGARGNLLNSSFHVRTRSLLNAIPEAANYQFLSGLLIGYEIKELAVGQHRVTVIGEPRLAECYRRALQVEGRADLTQTMDAASALVHGQARIATARGWL